jgi:uncharacterized protein (DUF302 family)
MKHWLAALLLVVPVLTLAGAAGVNILTTKEPADQVYDRVYQALEGAKFWVVFEADMGSRMDQLATAWGGDANKNKLTFVKSMVFCNLSWTNQLANADPELLGLCPLHLTVYHRDDRTAVSWPKLSVLAEGSPAHGTAQELEQELSAIIRSAVTPQ